MANNPYEQYQKQSVMTMTQGEMLTKLYEEIIKQLSGAVVFIDSKDFSKANQALQKAQKIFNHLKVTLDHKYRISQNLDSLYNFFIQQIILANIRKEVKPIQDIIPMVEELRDTFIQADRIARKQ